LPPIPSACQKAVTNQIRIWRNKEGCNVLQENKPVKQGVAPEETPFRRRGVQNTGG